MELLLEIREKDLGLEKTEVSGPMDLRRAARAVILNDKGEVVLMHVTRHGYHKLPGGGAEDDEEIEDGLKREVLEEAGAKIEVGEKLGVVLEHRNKWQFKNESHCFLAKAIGKPARPQLTESEEERGFEPIWVPLEEAIGLVENDNCDLYEPKFVKPRDLAFLKKAKEVLNS